MNKKKESGGNSMVVESAKSKKAAQAAQAAQTTTKIFLVAVLDISWQMAIVVLVPIIGGFELDKHFKTTPTLTIIGFILAMIGVFAVIRRAFKEYSSSLDGAKEQK